MQLTSSTEISITRPTVPQIKIKGKKKYGKKVKERKILIIVTQGRRFNEIVFFFFFLFVPKTNTVCSYNVIRTFFAFSIALNAR